MNAVLRQDLVRSAPLLLPAAGLAMFLLGLRLVLSLVMAGQSMEEAYPEWVLIVLTPFAWLVVRELGVREWTEGGHLAREALPLRGWRVFLDKVVWGALILAGLAVLGASLLAGALRLMRQADVSLPDQLLLGAGTWLVCVYGALWCLAACGRHRHAVALWAVVLGLGAEAVGALPAPLHALLRLAREDLLAPPERLRPLAEGGVALLVVASLPWWLARGRLTRSWSGPVGRRDLVAMALAAGLLLLVPAWSRVSGQPALRLEGAVAEAGPVRVRAPLDPAERAAATALAGSAATTLAPLAAGQAEGGLGLDVPPVGVELARGQQGFLRAELRGRRGVVVRADFLAADFPGARFQAWLLRAALDEATLERLRADPWRWLLDGWPRWRAADPAGDAPEPSRALRVAFAARALEREGLLGPGLFAGWERVRGAVGDELAAELAAWCVEALAGEAGPEAPDRLLRAVTRLRLRRLAALRDGASSLAAALEESCQVALPAFEQQLSERLRALVAARAEALSGSAAPAWEACRLEPVPGRDGVYLRLQVPAGGDASATALLVALDQGGLPERWDRGELLPGEEPLELGPWPAGSAVWVTWTRPCALLGGAEAISGWRRLVLP